MPTKSRELPVVRAARRLSSISNLFRNLRSQNLNFFYGRRHREKIWSLRHECFGNGPVKVTLPARLIVKAIDYAERSWAEPQREPQRSGRFLIRQLKTLLQEGGDFFFLPGFRLKSYKQSK